MTWFSWQANIQIPHTIINIHRFLTIHHPNLQQHQAHLKNTCFIPSPAEIVWANIHHTWVIWTVVGGSIRDICRYEHSHWKVGVGRLVSLLGWPIFRDHVSFGKCTLELNTSIGWMDIWWILTFKRVRYISAPPRSCLHPRRLTNRTWKSMVSKSEISKLPGGPQNLRFHWNTEFCPPLLDSKVLLVISVISSEWVAHPNTHQNWGLVVFGPQKHIPKLYIKHLGPGGILDV